MGVLRVCRVATASVGEVPLTLTRSLLTILIPGAVAVAPWALYLLLSYPSVWDLYEKHALPSQVLLFAVCVVVGSLFEGASTYLETRLDCSVGKRDSPDGTDDTWVDKDWINYLAASFGGGEPVAYRYLSRKVTSFYFELGMAISYSICSVGILHLLLKHDVSFGWIVTAAALHFAFPLLLLKYAADTHYLLCYTRSRVMKAL